MWKLWTAVAILVFGAWVVEALAQLFAFLVTL